MQEPEYLAYIEPLQPTPFCTHGNCADATHIHDRTSGLYKARRVLDEDGSRRGIVINLTEIWRPVDVVPAFGGSCPVAWTTDNAVERAKEFYVNPFYDKNMFRDL